MRPHLPCCTPRRAPFPSGWAWAHAEDCERSPRQKVQRGEDHPTRWNRSAWWSPQPYAGAATEATIWKLHHGRNG